MDKIKVSVVSYTNSKPFVYGLQHSGILDQIDLSLENPSACADKLINNQVDIGLVPVASLVHIPGYKIISDYCIGATGAVNSVFIFSKKPIELVKTIQLDKQSRTSNNLAKVLLKNHWNLKPRLVNEGIADAFVLIGDRTFGQKNNYPYVYDLAGEWQKFTQLPFVFAVWAVNKTVPGHFVTEFNAALKFGLDHRKEVISQLPIIKDFDLENYLMNCIDYHFDSKKQEALILFLTFLKQLELSSCTLIK